MSKSNKIAQAWAKRKAAKATKNSNNWDIGCLSIACLFLLLAVYTLYKLII